VILHLARDESGQPLADGQLVQQGYEVAEVAPTGSLIADVDLVGPDVARVRDGLPCRVRHHAWEDEPFEGLVLRLSPTLDPVTRTLRAEVSVENRGGRLRPGMFVEVTMIADRREDVPVVPREALAERGGRKVVFVVRGQRVSRREVVPGLGDDEIVEIRQGLEPGERIVVRGLETLTDGTRVQVSGS
jgi:RND family efflux transporter MFP subunit